MTEEPTPVTRPRRVAVEIPVVLEVKPDVLVKAIVDDLSKDGFRLRTRTRLTPGQNLTMHMPRETVHCVLRWVRGFVAGGVFRDDAETPAW